MCVVVRVYFSSRFSEGWAANNSRLMRNEAEGGGKHPKTIFDTAPEVDGGSFLEVLGWARDLADVEAKHYGLGNHLIVEDEVVGVIKER